MSQLFLLRRVVLVLPSFPELIVDLEDLRSLAYNLMSTGEEKKARRELFQECSGYYLRASARAAMRALGGVSRETLPSPH